MNAAGVDAEADTGVRPASNNYVPQDVAIRVRRGTVRGRGPNQQKYLHSIATHDINFGVGPAGTRSEEYTSELQSLMRISYAVFCLKTKHKKIQQHKQEPT